jgi:hypothetical protein
MNGPSHSVGSSTSTVLMKRGSEAGRKPTSAISSTLASRSRAPNAAANALRSSFQAESRMRCRMRSARSRQCTARSGIASTSAALDSRSHAAREARQRRDDALGELALQPDAVQRLDVAALFEIFAARCAPDCLDPVCT